MHEYSIVASLIERVEHLLDDHPRAAVRKVHVRIGEQAGVEIDLLRTAYDTFRERTVCERAELAIEPVPALWRCATCKRELERGAVLQCCRRPAQLVSGDDIVLARVEMEVRDV